MTVLLTQPVFKEQMFITVCKEWMLIIAERVIYDRRKYGQKTEYKYG